MSEKWITGFFKGTAEVERVAEALEGEDKGLDATETQEIQKCGKEWYCQQNRCEIDARQGKCNFPCLPG